MSRARRSRRSRRPNWVCRLGINAPNQCQTAWLPITVNEAYDYRLSRSAGQFAFGHGNESAEPQ
jgi:hypothetical protein